MRIYEINEGEESPITKNQMDFLQQTIRNKPADYFEYETISLNGKFIIVEKHTEVIVYETTNEDEADQLCDQFNQDKDVGKDALDYSLNKNRKIYNLV